VNGTLPVANGGTGATSLTGILKGNGTGAVTTVTAPAGDLVGTTATQTLSGKTLSAATLSGTTQATSISFGSAGAISKIGTTVLSVGGGNQVDVVAGAIRLQSTSGTIVFGPYATGPASPYLSAFPTPTPTNGYAQSVRLASVGGSVIVDGKFVAGTNSVENDDLVTVGNGDAYPVWPETQSNALALHKNGKLRVANTVDSKGGFRTPKMGDIEMGLFTAGPNPATLNAGLRYSGE
jgi:hypothetical protein